MVGLLGRSPGIPGRGGGGASELGRLGGGGGGGVSSQPALNRAFWDQATHYVAQHGRPLSWCEGTLTLTLTACCGPRHPSWWPSLSAACWTRTSSSRELQGGPPSAGTRVRRACAPHTLTGYCVPFVNRPFESEIHGTVKFTQFCCVLLVPWCYRVLLSCYLRPK